MTFFEARILENDARVKAEMARVYGMVAANEARDFDKQSPVWGAAAFEMAAERIDRLANDIHEAANRLS